MSSFPHFGVFHLILQFILISSLSFIGNVNGARVLCYFPNPSKSHVLLALPICEELANRGHSVVAVTNQKYGKNGTNYTEIVIKGKGYSQELFEALTSGKKPDSPLFMLKVCEDFVSENVLTITSPKFQKILKEDSFDLVFFISVFGNHVQLGIADHFKAPYITLSPLGSVYFTRNMNGAPSFSAAVPTKFSGLPKHMSLIQRVKNVLSTFIEMEMGTYLDYRQAREYAQYWPNASRSYKEMKHNVSLIYYNQYVAQSKIAQPLLPTEVEVGGIQINTKPKPLEPKLKQWLDDAKNGAILWTFGTNIPMTSVKPEKLEIMLKVLGGLKQRVVMKWESNDTSNIPKNFLAQEWLPQDSILAHSNVKLFINHGGAGGCNEAMFHRVPILGIPFFGDQPGNVQKHVEDGWARGMTLDQVTMKSFSDAVNDLLTNNTYRDNVVRLSDIYRDRIASALDTAVYWAEYVIKYRGASHLSYAGKCLNWPQSYNLDIFAILAVIVLSVIYIGKIVVVKIYKSFSRPPKKNELDGKKNK